MERVYVRAEIAQILKISEGNVEVLIEKGLLKAFEVLGQPRITESALAELMKHPYIPTMPASPAVSNQAAGAPVSPPSTIPGPTRANIRRAGLIHKNLALEQDARSWALAQIQSAAGQISQKSRKKKVFIAKGRKAIIAVSTTGNNPKGFWFGVSSAELSESPQAIIVAVLALQPSLFEAFVIPYAERRTLFDNLSRDQRGELKFNIVLHAGSWHLTGRGVVPPLDLLKYVNRFDVFK